MLASRYCRLLVVDDHEITRLAMADMLTRLGVEQVDMAHCGRAAIQLLETKQFDVVISDLCLPQLEGLAFVQHIRAKKETACVPIILTSNDIESSQFQIAIGYAHCYHLPKPFDVLELGNQLRTLLPYYVFNLD